MVEKEKGEHAGGFVMIFGHGAPVSKLHGLSERGYLVL